MIVGQIYWWKMKFSVFLPQWFHRIHTTIISTLILLNKRTLIENYFQTFIILQPSDWDNFAPCLSLFQWKHLMLERECVNNETEKSLDKEESQAYLFLARSANNVKSFLRCGNLICAVFSNLANFTAFAKIIRVWDEIFCTNLFVWCSQMLRIPLTFPFGCTVIPTLDENNKQWGTIVRQNPLGRLRTKLYSIESSVLYAVKSIAKAKH